MPRRAASRRLRPRLRPCVTETDAEDVAMTTEVDSSPGNESLVVTRMRSYTARFVVREIPRCLQSKALKLISFCKM